MEDRVIERPNRKAMSDALDIYRDVMRPFIVRCLKRVFPGRVEIEMRRAFREEQRDKQLRQFDGNRRSGRSIGDSIDINDFPWIVGYHWQEVFSREIKRGSVVIDVLSLIAEIRNEEAHPGSRDMDSEYVRARLYDVSSVLRDIDALGPAGIVEGIRNSLFAVTGDADHNGPGVKTPQKERTDIGPTISDTTDQAPRGVVERSFAGYKFKRVESIQPERNERGTLIEERVDGANSPLHNYGQGPFCRFRVAQGWRQSGVYVLASDGKPLYVGECKNLESVWRSYGQISPSAVKKGGNQTYCRINNRILNEANQRKELILWFHAITEDKQRKRCKADLTNKLNPLENRTSPRSPH